MGSADKILALLAARHAKDVFVSECKDGPTWNGPHLRLDAWAMNRSWANPLIRGYEIKVARPDFLGDQKWHEYLGLCNEFYFVAPAGLIDPKELGPEVGLLSVSRTGSRLYTKKKAAYREVAIPEALYQYILMSRAHIVPPHTPDFESKADYWRSWLALKREDQQLGWNVSARLRQRYTEDVEAVRSDQRALDARLALYEKVAGMCKDLGICPRVWNVESEARRKLEALKAAVPTELRVAVGVAADAMGRLRQLLDGSGACNPGEPGSE